MRSRLSQRLNALRESARWRGSFITVLLALRKLVRPILYFDVYRIFETDITQAVPQSYGEENVEVRIFSPDDGLMIADDAISAELERDRAQLRFARGDLVGIAFLKERPVGYMWISLSSGVELGLDTDTYWIIRAGEAVRYGSFVLPAFRGRGIHSCLNTAVTTYLRNREITRVLGAVSILNPPIDEPSEALQPSHIHDHICRPSSRNWLDHSQIVSRSLSFPVFMATALSKSSCRAVVSA